jgi:hypothetical protein
MRTIIAGSRTITDYKTIKKYLDRLDWDITVVISGMARGVDQLGEWWAIENNIPIERFPAQWKKYGRRAGYNRNLLMAQNAEALVAFWDNQSKGTKMMIDIAKEYKLKIKVEIIN